MNFLSILQLIIVIATLLTGVAALFWPRRIQGFIGLQAPGARGITEIRSIFGGVFIGLGIAILALGTPETYKLLGIVYAAIAAIRAISMVTDKSFEQSNTISLVTDIEHALHVSDLDASPVPCGVDNRQHDKAPFGVIVPVHPRQGIEVGHLPEKEHGENCQTGHANLAGTGCIARQRRQRSRQSAHQGVQVTATFHWSVDPDVQGDGQAGKERSKRIQ